MVNYNYVVLHKDSKHIDEMTLVLVNYVIDSRMSKLANFIINVNSCMTTLAKPSGLSAATLFH